MYPRAPLLSRDDGFNHVPSRYLDTNKLLSYNTHVDNPRPISGTCQLLAEIPNRVQITHTHNGREPGFGSTHMMILGIARRTRVVQMQIRDDPCRIGKSDKYPN